MSAGLVPTTTAIAEAGRVRPGMRAMAPIVTAYVPFGLVVERSAAAGASISTSVPG